MRIHLIWVHCSLSASEIKKKYINLKSWQYQEPFSLTERTMNQASSSQQSGLPHRVADSRMSVVNATPQRWLLAPAHIPFALAVCVCVCVCVWVLSSLMFLMQQRLCFRKAEHPKTTVWDIWQKNQFFWEKVRLDRFLREVFLIWGVTL